MEQRFIDKIENLRHNTYSRITSIQKDVCPMIRKMYLNYQFEYWYEGYKHNLWEDNVHIYAVNDLPYCYDNEIKNTTFTDTLDNLVRDDKVWPFLLFIEGVAIKWSKITVIHDYDYTYLRIDDITPDHSFYVDIVSFPISSKLIRYGEDNDIILTPNRKGFYFDRNGKRLESTDFADISIRLEILDKNIYYKEINLNDITDNLLSFTDLPDGFIPTLNNILIFGNDGLFNAEGPNLKIEDIFKGTFGLFKLKEVNTDAKWAILMYNTNGNKEKSYIYSKSKDLDRKRIINLLKENASDISKDIWTDIISPLIDIFDFDYSRQLTSEKNKSNSTKYITRYDFALWKDAYVDDLNIKSFTYTGKEFKSLADDRGYLHLSRKHSELIQDVVIVFVNNKIYPYEVDINYVNNTINIPIFGIFDNDCIEILMFTSCNNLVLNANISSNTSPIYIHPDYDLGDCDIMSEDCPEAEYEVPESLDGRKQYLVDFTYTKDNNNYYIEFSNNYYYGKNIKIVPKRQFRYYRYKYTPGQYKVILPTQFNYCHNPDQYLIFINGKKIDKEEYTITFMNKYRPFDKLVLYVSTILDAGDYIDIFYIPEVLISKYKQDTIPSSGLLILEDTDTNINYPTTYPLSKDTAMVFVNGLKVNPLQIKDISLNSLLIHVDKYKRDDDGHIIFDGDDNPVLDPASIDSIDNIEILEYTPGNKTVAGYLKGLYEQLDPSSPYDPENINFNHSASDNWKELIQTIITKYSETGLPYTGLQLIFGDIFEREDHAENYKNNFADLKSVLYDVIIDYYLNRDQAETGDKFTYDFEADKFDNVSETDNTKKIPLVSEKDKMFDYDPVDTVATQTDVKAGQKFIPADS